MSATTAVLLLQQNELFRDLPPAALDKIAALARRRHFSAGEIIFLQGDPGDSLYGVVSGSVRITAGGADGKHIQLNAFAAGECFGEIALLDGDPRSGTATAESDTELIVIERSPLLVLLDNEPQLSRHLITVLCRRLRQTARLAEDAVLQGVPARLAKRLLELGTGSADQDEAGFQVKVTQGQLAQSLGTSRQIVNRYLQEWSRQGIVESSRGCVRIRDIEALRTAGQADGD